MKRLEVAELLLLAALWGGSFLFMWIAASVLGSIWLIELRVLPSRFGTVTDCSPLKSLTKSNLQFHWKPALNRFAIEFGDRFPT